MKKSSVTINREKKRRQPNGNGGARFGEAFQTLDKKLQGPDNVISDRKNTVKQVSGNNSRETVVVSPSANKRKIGNKNDSKNLDNTKDISELDSRVALKVEPIEDVVKIETEQLEEEAEVEDELENMLLSEHDDFANSEQTDNADNNNDKGIAEIDKADYTDTRRRKSKRISKLSHQKKDAFIVTGSKDKTSTSLKLKLKRALPEGDVESEYKYKCGSCLAKFRFAHQHYKHRKSHLTETKPLDIRNMYAIENGKKVIIGRICTICDRKVKGRGNKLYTFVEHMLSHENFAVDQSTPLYSCDQCDRTFNIELNLDLHKKYNHEWQNIYLKCEFCESTSRNQAEFALHLKSHEGVTRTHCCKNCPMVCTSLDNLLEHMVKHSRSKLLYCPECPHLVLPTIKELYLHCEAVHAELKEKFNCAHCGKKYLLPATLRTHLRVIHGEGVEANNDEGEFICLQCNKGKVYKSNQLFERHVKYYHNRDTDRYKCDKCENVSFAYKCLLRKHVQDKHDRTRYPCPHCPNTYSDKPDLSHHIKTHTGEGLLSCPVCAKTFPTQGQLKVHAAVHMKKNSENSFVCDTCGKKFVTETRLRQHKVNHRRKHQCSYPKCNMVFARPENLKSHERTHIGERPYACPICKKAFNRPDIRVVHMKSHEMSHEEAKQFYKPESDEKSH